MQSITREIVYIRQFYHAYAAAIEGERSGIGQRMRPSDGFVFVVDGECAYTPECGEPFVARAGDVIFLAKNAAYGMSVGVRGFSYICVNFEFDSCEKRSCMLASPDAEAETEALFRRLVRAGASRQKQGLLEVMALLYRIYGTVFLSDNREYIGRGVKETVSESKAQMERGFTDPMLSVSALAQAAGMSETYYRALFRSQYGTSPLQYLIGLRLGRAISLMSDPMLSLSSCAEKSGFSSLSYFCRIFKRKMGVTPARYRRERGALLLL